MGIFENWQDKRAQKKAELQAESLRIREEYQKAEQELQEAQSRVDNIGTDLKRIEDEVREEVNQMRRKYSEGAEEGKARGEAARQSRLEAESRLREFDENPGLSEQQIEAKNKRESSQKENDDHMTDYEKRRDDMMASLRQGSDERLQSRKQEENQTTEKRIGELEERIKNAPTPPRIRE